MSRTRANQPPQLRQWRFRRAAPLLALLCIGSVSLSAHAAPSEADKRKAASLMILGDKDAAAERFPEALKSYRQADAIMGVPSTGVAVARVLAKTGKLLEARRVAQQVQEIPEAAGEPQAFVNARAEAARLLTELDERIPTLLLTFVAPAGSEPEIRVDGELLPAEQVGVAQQMDPGTYVLSAVVAGSDPVQREITLKEGDQERVELQLGAPADSTAGGAGELDTQNPSGSGLRLGAYVGLGVGAIATGVGVLYAIKLGSTRSDSDAAFERCGSPCRDTNPEAANVRELDDQADSEKLISTVGFIVGGVGIATGVVLWMLSSGGEEQPQGAPPPSSAVRIQPWLGLGSAGVFGQF